MRLNAYLARAGVASRRGADELIKAGRVTVNGARGELNTFVGSADDVRVDGRVIGAQRLRHVLLNKPQDTITTARDPEGRSTVVDLVGGDVRIVPVGRLDRDTTGALLLTNDGPLAHRLAHPRYGVEKAYVADVEGEPDDDVAAPARGGSRVGRRADGARARAETRPVPSRARPARRAKPAGAADAGGGRSSGGEAPSRSLCGARDGPAAAGGVARPHVRRGRLAPSSRRPVGGSATRTRRAWRGPRRG